MTTVYMVLCDNGLGNSGNVVLGLYPTHALAVRRMVDCQFTEEADYIWIEMVEVGPDGADCFVRVHG